MRAMRSGRRWARTAAAITLALCAAAAAAAGQPVTGDLRAWTGADGVTRLTGHVCAPPDVIGAASRPQLQVTGPGGGAVTQLFELSPADRQAYRVIGQDCAADSRVFLVSQVIGAPVRDIGGVTLGARDGTAHPLPLRRARRETSQKFGIVYSLDHCLVSDTRHNVAPEQPIFNTTRISRMPGGARGWGPVRWNHWIDKPLDGYYCLTGNKRLARKHAFLLSVMGVDFVILDMTNMAVAATRDRPDRYSDEFRTKVAGPVGTLMATWRDLAARPRPVDVPRIVPWAGMFLETRKAKIAPERSIVRYLVGDFLPGLHEAGLGMPVDGSGKPLLLVKMNYTYRFNPNRAVEVIRHFGLKRHFTTRAMWADRKKLEARFGNRQERNAGMRGPDNFWSFLEPCRMSDGRIATGCHQSAGSPEQISVSVGYPSDTFMSIERETHRRRGRTLFQQFQKVFADDGRTPFVVLSVWNPWTNPRQCPPVNGNNPNGKGPPLVWNDFASHAARDCIGGLSYYPGGAPAFLDNYDLERSKLIEPDRDWGDCYMSLARDLIFAARAGRDDLSAAQRKRFAACSDDGFDLRR